MYDAFLVVGRGGGSTFAHSRSLAFRGNRERCGKEKRQKKKRERDNTRFPLSKV